MSTDRRHHATCRYHIPDFLSPVKRVESVNKSTFIFMMFQSRIVGLFTLEVTSSGNLRTEENQTNQLQAVF